MKPAPAPHVPGSTEAERLTPSSVRSSARWQFSTTFNGQRLRFAVARSAKWVRLVSEYHQSSPEILHDALPATAALDARRPSGLGLRFDRLHGVTPRRTWDVRSTV